MSLSLAASEERSPGRVGQLIKPRGPWRIVEQVEIATLEYVD